YMYVTRLCLHLSLFTPPRPPRSPLFPYTTLFRSRVDRVSAPPADVGLRGVSPPTILFVCLHGAAKSVDAAAEFERPDAARAGERSESTRLNSSHQIISYAVFCLKKKKKEQTSPAQ